MRSAWPAWKVTGGDWTHSLVADVRPLLKRPRLFRQSLVSVLAFAITFLGLLLFHPTFKSETAKHISTVASSLSLTFPTFGATADDPFSPLTLAGRQRLLHGLEKVAALNDERGPFQDFLGRDLDRRSIARLQHCLTQDTCTQNETTIIMLNDWEFSFCQISTTRGETVWSLSLLEGFKAFNYTLLYPSTPLDVDYYNRYLGHRTPIIIWQRQMFEQCVDYHAMKFVNNSASEVVERSVDTGADTGTSVSGQRSLKKRFGEDGGDWWQINGTYIGGCMQTAEYPQGVEMWKSLIFDFWPRAVSPLGPGWSLSPVWYKINWTPETEWEDDQGSWLNAQEVSPNRFTGYAIERRCKAVPFIPHEQRLHRAVVLGKRSEYYGRNHNAFYGLFQQVKDNITSLTGQDFSFFTAATDFEANGRELESGIDMASHGMGSEDWMDNLGKSAVLVGIGRPTISPSPFDALCMGVPFINVIQSYDAEQPEDRSRWETQHQGLRDLDAPYVYHVRRGDGKGLQNAILQAINNPIGRFIPDRMRESQIERRMEALVHHPFRQQAQDVVQRSYLPDDYRWLP